VEFRVEGLDCADEVAILRRQLDGRPGVRKLVFDVVHAKMTVEFDPKLTDAEQLQAAAGETGMRCHRWSERLEKSFWERHSRSALAWLSGICLVAATLTYGLLTGDFFTAFFAHDHAHDSHRAIVPVIVLSLLGILSGAWYVLPKAWYSLRTLRPDMNLLVAISLVGAVYLGEWLEGATLSFLFAVAALLESYSVSKARNAVAGLMKFAPGEASVVHGDHEHKTPVNQLKVGTVVRVRPGERIPCDGDVTAGASDVDQALITGESIPVAKAPGEHVYAGTINGDGVLEVRVTSPATDTTLARIVRMVENCQQRRAPSERFVEKFARYYTPAMILLATAVVVLPPMLGGGDWSYWFYQGMVILLISCPCALVISTPVSIVAALASAAKHGVLLKGGAFLEEAARLRAVAFDKTGVLTEGQPEVRELVPLNGWDRDAILKRLAALEYHSEHPLARAVVRYARANQVDTGGVSNFQVLQGRGAEAEIDGERFWAGNVRLLREKNLASEEVNAAVDRMGRDEGSVVVCGSDTAALALVKLSDPVREETREVVRRLRAAGVERTVMLTGDNAATAAAVAADVEVDEVRAELLPSDKADAVAELRRRYGHVAMVGDGVNDAQAMASSTLGIALGGSGVDVVMETSDVVLVSGGLKKLPFLLRHARRTLAIIKQNIAIAIALKAAFLVLAFFGLATLWMAIAADMGATLLVTFNGLRLLRARNVEPRANDDLGGYRYRSADAVT
jgi:Zn2+/Cd2+-exporting ATPase